MNEDIFRTEEELIMVLRTNKTIAVRGLYDKYSAALLGRISLVIDQLELAEKVLNDVFVEAWITADSFDKHQCQLFTWLSHIATRHTNEFIQKEGMGGNRSDDIQIYLGKTKRGVEFYRLNLGVREVVPGISEEWSDVLYAVYFLGYTEAETSRILNLPLDTVRTSVRLAVLELRNIYRRNM